MILFYTDSVGLSRNIHKNFHISPLCRFSKLFFRVLSSIFTIRKGFPFNLMKTAVIFSLCAAVFVSARLLLFHLSAKKRRHGLRKFDFRFAARRIVRFGDKEYAAHHVSGSDDGGAHRDIGRFVIRAYGCSCSVLSGKESAGGHNLFKLRTDSLIRYTAPGASGGGE